MLALAPGLKLLSKTENEYRDMLLGLIRLAMRLGRVLLLPEPYGDEPWVRGQRAAGSLDTGGVGWGGGV